MLLKMRHVIERTKSSRSTIYKLMRAGKFPMPARVGRDLVWSERQLDDWENNLTGDDVCKKS